MLQFCLRRQRRNWVSPGNEDGGLIKDGMDEEAVRNRLRHAKNCLERFEEFDSSATEQLREEVDYLRRTLLACPRDIIDLDKHLQDARQSFPRRILRAFMTLTDLNPVLPLPHPRTSHTLLTNRL